MKHASFIIVAAVALVACGGDKAAAPVIVPPVLDSISPSRGTVGTLVRLNGSAFANDSVRVYFGALASPQVERQSGVLYATAPEGLVLGTRYDVRVVNRDGGTDTLLAAFEVVAPTVTRVNGVTKPTGLIGMTVLIEGDAFGDARHGKVFFAGSGGTPIQAVIADSANDWTNNYIVTTVPSGTPNTSGITVQTATGTTASIAFNLITGATFSPSVINWTRTVDLPQPLQGLGALFVPPANSAINTANYVFVVGGAADQTNTATSLVYRAQAQQSGALSAWTPMPDLPAPRAYHAAAAASAYTAAIDTVTTGGWLYVIGGVDGT
ncbi:MAG TPA: IPT/TIG domain-containing protein, partial [Gemmatimonadaceae bacterium]|nr:IPT/TIG domain-containing protein [Gemmatimonadaceae bacterium]